MSEITILGEPVYHWQAMRLGGELEDGAIPVDIDTFHHDWFPLADDHMLVFTSELRRLDRFPLNFRHPDRSLGQAHVIGDVIVEMTTAGRIVNRWPLFDILDPLRVSYSSHDTFWDTRGYADVPGGTKDWTHANALVQDPADGNIIVSLRHQDAIVKIDRQTSEVIWILGTRAGWRPPLVHKVLKPTRRMEWPFHAHGVKLTPQGTLLMFDNGNLRAIPPARPLSVFKMSSRAVELRVDEPAMSVTQVWSYGEAKQERFFAPFLGDADWLPTTGNVLITDGAGVTDEHGRPTDEPPGGIQWARLLEVTHDDPAQVVWELLLDDRETRPELGWSIYRAERLPSLYPPE